MASFDRASSPTAIDFQDVEVSRGGRPVLRGVTLGVRAGEVVALVGRSGSGKTTLLRLVNRLADADSGTVQVSGTDVATWDAIALRRQVGYAIQDVGLFPHFTVADNVGTVPRLLEWPADRVAARVDELLTLVGLEPSQFRGRWPDQLSGGQRQRVGLARALAADPPVLLMDEPFGALDPITRVELHREFRALQAKLPRAVLLVTHDLSEAFALAARIAVLHEGRVLACDTPERLGEVDDEHVRALLDTPIRMSALFDFLASHRAELAMRTGEHLVLVMASIAIATLIGIPVGILAARRPSLARPLVGLANLAQTVPSLALFGFLIPLPLIGGIGTRTALIALTLYGILPIVRTTVAGIKGVDQAVLECAVAMGLTPRQILRQVELPLAAPAILAGVRVATVVGVGTATIASAIGAGGLGDYIFRGLSMVDPVVILAGALPAAVLALLADGALAMAARALDPRRGSRRLRLTLVAGSVALAVALYGGLRATTTQAAIVIGSKNFTEQIVLGELLAQTIEATGLIVERRLNLGGTLVCDEALKRGDIDGYVEYTGTALTALFKEPFDQLRSGTANATLSARVLEIVRERYADSGRTLLPGLGFNNTFAILVRTADRDARKLRTISDLARVAPEWRAGFGYEFLERPDGFPGLARSYNLRFREAPRVMDLNLIYRAVASGEIDVTAGDATSGLIRALNLTILQDDREYFPPYDAAPVFRTATLLRYPEADRAVRALAGRITADDMQRLNHEVDGLRKEPRDVVAAFLANR